MNTKEFDIDYSYDADADAMFIYMKGKYNYDYSIPLTNDIILDLDINGVPVALEILNTSKIFNISKYYFEKVPFIDLNVLVGENLIKVNCVIGLYIRNKKVSKSVNEMIVNSFNLPVSQFKLANV
jgi:uncharacterized protein YuzE